ncbi:hypothetical protein [Uliginosibacterium gangwonense]|uniref:hypothetical protein n=1 Tax=Uliginosibacterium gangwonense TaxID=392736 RepID=UPI00037BCCB7|nr:hypothetical protein [Uliginosibacterium gangwonense]
MAHIVFWGKPGCKTNAAQSAHLAAAGHSLEVRNILTEPWTEQRLLDFLLDLPVAQWFNPNAPKVKSGEIEPEHYNVASALHLLVGEPLLIRRPLLEIAQVRLAGFNLEQLRHHITLPESRAFPPEQCSSPSEPCPPSQ